MARPLVLIGASGLAREVAEAACASGEWDVLGVLDDDRTLHGGEVGGLRVLGSPEQAHDLAQASVVLCVAAQQRPYARLRLVERLGLAERRYATIVHPAASLGRSARVGPGSVVLAGVVLTADVVVGSHVVLMPQVVLTHDDVVGDLVTLGAGVRLAGRVVVGEGAYVGSGALVREDTKVGAWSLLGMGSVVLRDVPGHETWAGAPARFLRHRP